MIIFPAAPDPEPEFKTDQVSGGEDAVSLIDPPSSSSVEGGAQTDAAIEDVNLEKDRTTDKISSSVTFTRYCPSVQSPVSHLQLRPWPYDEGYNFCVELEELLSAMVMQENLIGAKIVFRIKWIKCWP